jgi:pimeloyl-ACP methyl ester carboxylesterase
MLLLTQPAGAQVQPGGGGQGSSFAIFVRGTRVGTEEVTVTRNDQGWTISSFGRLNAPLDFVNRRLEIHYDADWRPLELIFDSAVRGQPQSLHTTLSGNTATSSITVAGEGRVITATTNSGLLLPTPFFAAFEALSARLRTAEPGTSIAAFAPPQADLVIHVGESTEERIQTPRELIEARHSLVTIRSQAVLTPPYEAHIWADRNGRLLRLSIPTQALEVAREDISSVATRHVPISRPNDEQVRIAANGFVLTGTLSRPADSGQQRLPAVLLVSGSGPTDRDEMAFGIPIFGQLADALADAGFAVLRYDKRGIGQSGGRTEAATLAHYMEDVRAAVRFLDDRDDIDHDRIAVLGYDEGGPVAMLAASKEKRIAALILVASPGTTGAEFNLEQVSRTQARSSRSEADRQATIELQKRIQQAVLTGEGWDDEIAPYRAQADTLWFQSFLAFEPDRVMRDVRQPVLIVHGELDTQVPAGNADRLEQLAVQRRNRAPAKLVKLPGINHLLVPATTGEVDEYESLKERSVGAQVATTLVEWLRSTPAR